jgi:hypothetical protein
MCCTSSAQWGATKLNENRPGNTAYDEHITDTLILDRHQKVESENFWNMIKL